MSKIHKVLILWFIIGLLYYALEGVWRICTNGGWANISMMPVGGLCGVVVGGINQFKIFRRLNMPFQAVFGAFCVLIIEFLSGCVLNLWLKLGIWDYSDMPLNILGQVCLLYTVLWFFLMPFAIWLEDTLRWNLWHDGKPYALGSAYKRLVVTSVKKP